MKSIVPHPLEWIEKNQSPSLGNHWHKNAKFKNGQHVTKIKGSRWTGKVVGFYSTELTPIGYAVESDTEKGSVQIYPESALELCQPAAVSADAVTVAGKIHAEAYQLVEVFKGTEKVGERHQFSLNKAADFIQAYGDACRLDGARRMQEAAAKLAEQLPDKWLYAGKRERFDRRQMEDQRSNTAGMIAEDIRALSPETVCGGE